MEIQLTPEMQARLDDWSSKTGQPPDDFVRDAIEGHLEELTQVNAMLDRRYDDVVTGRVKLIPGEEVISRLHAKIAALTV